MKTRALLAICLLAACAARAENGAAQKAEAALRDGIPQAAIAPLEEAIKKAAPNEKHALGLLLARAFLAAGNPAAAKRVLETDCDRRSADTIQLRAAALAAQGDLREAARLAEPLAATSPAAALLLARIRLEQGDSETAEALVRGAKGTAPRDPYTLRMLLDLQLARGAWDDAEAEIAAARAASLLPATELDVALGRVRLGQSRPSDASEIFRNVLVSGDIPGPVRDNARLGLARALATLGIDARARDVLREGLSEAPDALTTRESMEMWLELERKLGADPSTDLRTWAPQKASRRTLEARLQMARVDLRLKRADLAIAALEELATTPGLQPSDALRVQLQLAEARIAGNQTAAALATLDKIAASGQGAPYAYRIADLRGRALAAAGSYRDAHDAFAAAGKSARTTEETAAAAANRLLCALSAKDLALAREAHDVLRRAAPASPDLVRWTFLLAAAEAKNGNTDSLAALAQRSPAAEYAFQAKLALAEWRLARGEAAAAERILRTARDGAGTEQQAAALSAAEIFAADNAGSLSREELLSACRTFLDRHPQAPEAGDIAFKAAELHSRGGDHAAAESVLAGLAQNLSDPEGAALAKFLAAQSAARSMSADGAGRAMAWFDEIAQGTSSLRHLARLEQASLLLRQRRLGDAITLYDRMLAADLPPEARYAALMEKGDTLFAMGSDNAAKFDEAAALYTTIAADKSAPADWRDQAACKRAAALAKGGKTAAALAAYRDVLARPPGDSADHFWFYKAGLEAARLLEEQQDWPAAIAVYDQMAEVPGPQRDELKQRSRRLRLEHFIWEN